ncbi:MAG: PKD domain-containing protein, partial [Thermoplasmata archaeon]|nr:PKD domain-containing protein [Thermoplasmata archaeon]
AEASSTAVMTGMTVTFSATPLGGTAPFEVTWTLGDGASATGAVVVHGYNRTGSFDVVATVVDQTGARITQSLSVVVSPPGSATTPSTGPPNGWYLWGPLVGGVAIVGGAVAVVWDRRRRRRRRNAVGPIAVAGLRDEDWEDAGRDATPSSRRYDGRARR